MSETKPEIPWDKYLEQQKAARRRPPRPVKTGGKGGVVLVYVVSALLLLGVIGMMIETNKELSSNCADQPINGQVVCVDKAGNITVEDR